MPWTNWIAGIVAVYCTLFGIGKIIFGETMTGGILLVVAAIAFYWISRSFREGAENRSDDIADRQRSAASDQPSATATS